MARKKVKKVKAGTMQGRAAVELENMNIRALQKECALRGLSPRRVVKWDVPKLSSWFLEHFLDDRVPQNLIEHDKAVMELIQKRNEKLGKTMEPSLAHPSLRLSYAGEDSDRAPRVARIKGFKTVKKKRERSEQGVFKGTKKALTYELATKGTPKADVIKMVLEEFPDAREKSIGIWFNKAIKSMGDGK